MNVAPYYSPPVVVEDLPAPEPQPFEVRRVLAEARATFFRNPLALTVLIGLGVGLSIACDFATGRAFAPGPDMSYAASFGMLAIAHVAKLVVNTFLAIGTIRVSLAAVRGEPFGVRTLFSGGDVVFRAIGSNIAATFLVVIGMLLFIVPGCVLALGFGFTLHLIADRRADAIESLLSSLRITRGQRGRMLLLGVASLLLAACGVALLGVGLLAALPIAYLAWAHAYVTIIGE